MTRWQPNPKILNQKIPNQPIFLYQGFAELINNEQVIEGKAFVRMSWYPSPNVNFKFVYQGEDRLDSEQQENLQLKLTELDSQPRLKVYISHRKYWGTGKNQLSGYLTEPYVKGTTTNLSSVVFYIPNFWWFNISNDFDFEEDEQGNTREVQREGWLFFEGQFVFDYDNWHIVLATLDSCYELIELLDSEGGYGVTHICKIERLDEAQFSLEEASKILEAFSYYLSFVRGIWIAPILVSGFDSEGKELLEEWRNPLLQGDSWQGDYDWAWVDSTTNIVAPFAGFMKKWQDETWRETIQNAIQWYVESLKHTSGYNTSMVLLPAALEKIAWVYLSSNDCISPGGFQQLPFDDKVRLLLKYLEIPLIELDEQCELKKFAKQNNCLDSISTIGLIRNFVVHPKVNKKQETMKISEEIFIEAFGVAHSYLLSCLLKLFEYPYSVI